MRSDYNNPFIHSRMIECMTAVTLPRIQFVIDYFEAMERNDPQQYRRVQQQEINATIYRSARYRQNIYWITGKDWGIVGGHGESLQSLEDMLKVTLDMLKQRGFKKLAMSL